MLKEYKHLITTAIILLCILAVLTFVITGPGSTAPDMSDKQQIKEYPLKNSNGTDAGITFFANERFLENKKKIQGKIDENDLTAPVKKYKVSIDSEVVREKEGSRPESINSLQDYAEAMYGLDIEKTFDVDIDSKREKFREDMSSKADAKLEEELLQQGMDQETVNRFMSIRKEVRNKIKNSNPGIYQYDITAEPDME